MIYLGGLYIVLFFGSKMKSYWTSFQKFGNSRDLHKGFLFIVRSNPSGKDSEAESMTVFFFFFWKRAFLLRLGILRKIRKCGNFDFIPSVNRGFGGRLVIHSTVGFFLSLRIEECGKWKKARVEFHRWKNNEKVYWSRYAAKFYRLTHYLL